MKTANFPARKNRRRSAAVTRKLSDDVRANTMANMAPDARNKRTKKIGGKIARQAAWRRAG